MNEEETHRLSQQIINKLYELSNYDEIIDKLKENHT